jgi:hypothetical protein
MQITPGDMPFQMLPPGRQPKTGTGRLRGAVVAADTGASVRRAQVRISSPDIGTKTALTDGQGRYEFKDLPAGRFNVSVAKSGFVTMQYGQTRPFETGRPIDLVDAQIMEKADVALPRGSAVSGRILDEFGEPVSTRASPRCGCSTRAASAASFRRDARRRPTISASSASFGLPPGEYYVSATLRTIDSMVMDMLGGSTLGGPTGSNNNSGYAATYYPGTPNAGEAQRLSLALGQELPSIDIQMQPVRLARITGTAVGSDGKPMTGALVMLMPTMKEALMMAPGGTSRTDKDGNFSLSGVAPGEYSLQVQSLAALMNAASQAMSMISGAEGGTAAPPPQPMEREFATANVTVAGEDLTGMMLTATHGAKAVRQARVRGRHEAGDDHDAAIDRGPTDIDNMPATASVFGHEQRQGERRVRDGRPRRRPLVPLHEPAEGLVLEARHARRRRRHRHRLRLQARRQRRRLRDRAHDAHADRDRQRHQRQGRRGEGIHRRRLRAGRRQVEADRRPLAAVGAPRSTGAVQDRRPAAGGLLRRCRRVRRRGGMDRSGVDGPRRRRTRRSSRSAKGRRRRSTSNC